MAVGLADSGCVRVLVERQTREGRVEGSEVFGSRGGRSGQRLKRDETRRNQQRRFNSAN
jgi:hypothetical protein